MGVQNPPWEHGQRAWAQTLHVAGKEDDVGARPLERATDRRIEGVAVGMRHGREVERLDAGRRSPPQRTRPAVVADHGHHTTVDASLSTAINDGLKRRTLV
jgi:hypothetical protein